MHLSWFSTTMWISLGNTSRSVITHTRGRPLALVAWGEAACQTFSPFLCFPETFHALASGQTVATTEVWYSDTGQPRHPSPTQSPPASCNPTDLLIYPSPLPGPHPSQWQCVNFFDQTKKGRDDISIMLRWVCDCCWKVKVTMCEFYENWVKVTEVSSEWAI